MSRVEHNHVRYLRLRALGLVEQVLVAAVVEFQSRQRRDYCRTCREGLSCACWTSPYQRAEQVLLQASEAQA